MKRIAGRAAELLARTGVLRALETLDRATRRVAILVYHRIDEPAAEPDLDPGLVSATPADFRAQMEVLATHAHPISLAQLIDAHLEQRPLPPRAVLVTFDDGYRDFATHAWPVLRSMDIPAVLFVPTAFPDGTPEGFWWDRLHSALARTRERTLEVEGFGSLSLADPAHRRAAHRTLRDRFKSLPHDEALAGLDRLIARLADVPPLNRVLGWDVLRTLAREGLAVCSHGESHALHTRLTPDALRRELVESRSRIERELEDAAPRPTLAYPANANDPRVQAAVREAGYLLAFGGRRGIARLPLANPLDLVRLPVLRYATALFRAQLRPIVAGWGARLTAARS